MKRIISTTLEYFHFQPIMYQIISLFKIELRTRLRLVLTTTINLKTKDNFEEVKNYKEIFIREKDEGYEKDFFHLNR